MRIPNKEEAEEVKRQIREEIIKRIQRVADALKENHAILAVSKLKSGDLTIHTNSPAAKEEMETETN